MPSDALNRLFALIAERVRVDAAWREAVRDVAAELTSAERMAADVPASAASPAAAIAPPAVPAKVAGPVEVLPPLTFATAAPPAEAAPRGPTPVHDAAPAFDLKLMADRFAVKREGCEWHVGRRNLLHQPGVNFDEQIAPRDREVMDRARALPGGCWMWMCRPESPTPELPLMELAARAYDNLAQAALLTRDVLDDPKLAGRHEDTVFPLLAEALSATRVILEQIDAADRDHKLTFEWLRNQTSTRDIFIARYMKIDDPADPAEWNDLSERIAAVRGRIRNVQTSQQQQKQLINAIRYHCQKLSTADGADVGGHWGKVIAACTDLVRHGVPASNTQIRDLLTPVIDSLPGDQPATAEFEHVLRSIDTYLASREIEASANPDAAAPTAEVLRVRAALAGRSVVLIGGESRPKARDKIKDAFGFAEVYWPDTRVHESHYNFQSLIARPEVAVVLLAIRWSGHAFGEVKAFCDAAGKPLIRLPAGYHPNAIAHEIIDQAALKLNVPAG